MTITIKPKRVRDAEKIRPRTDEERLAYMTGWAGAVSLADKKGLEYARGELRLMWELEQR